MVFDDERIILNVGGIKYETNRSTITQYPDTYLGALFNENYKQPTKGNEYFFDRNGYAFRYILEYYRTGQILWTPPSIDSEYCNGISLKEMIIEFEFFRIPNKLKEQSDHDDKEYDLNEIRELFKEMSVTTFPSTTSNNSKTEPLSINNPPNPPNPNAPSDSGKFGTTGNQHNNSYVKFDATGPQSNYPHTNHYYYPPNNNNNNEMFRLRRWATVEEHVQVLDSFVMALSSIIYEIHHSLRRRVGIYFHSRKDNNHTSSIEFDLDLDSIKEIMKPFKASGFKLLEWYGNDIGKKLLRDFNETIEFIISSQSANTIVVVITILTQINNQYILSKSSLIKR